MSDPLSRTAVAGVDSADMLGDVLDMPAQLSDALFRFGAAQAPRMDAPGGLCVCGMGGSAIGADLARAAIGGRATRPIRTVRDYRLEPWADDSALVFCASYSGDTEETLSAYEHAGELGAPRLVMTTGGALAQAARRDGVPVVGVPAGFQPRAAVAYMTVGALEAAALCGAAPSLRAEVEASAALLGRLCEEWRPEGGDDLARRLARALEGRIPTVIGSGEVAPVAARWKTQLNENPGIPAHATSLPEADHNEIAGWAAASEHPLAVVLLEDHAPERVRRRVDLTAELAERSGIAVERVRARGETALEHVLSLVLLGDLVSIYLAALRGQDPTPVAAIDELKEGLGPV